MIIKRKKKKFKPIGQSEKFDHIDWAKQVIKDNPDSSLEDLKKLCPDNKETQLYISALTRLHKDMKKL